MSNTALILLFISGALLGGLVTWLYHKVVGADVVPAVPTGTMPDELSQPASYVVMSYGLPVMFRQGQATICLMISATKFPTQEKARLAAGKAGMIAGDYTIQPTIFAPNDHQS